MKKTFVHIRGALCFFLTTTLVGSEVKTPAQWYADGCSAYEQSDYGRACCLWQRACAVGGNSLVAQRVAHNYACLAQKVGIEVPSLSWGQKLQKKAAQVPLLLMQLIFLFFFFRALFFVYRGRFYRTTRVAMAWVHGVFVVLSALLLLNAYLFELCTMAVVVQEQQVLYAGPGNDYPEREQVPYCSLVEICGLRGEWYKVRLSAGGIGWMPRAALMSVKP